MIKNYKIKHIINHKTRLQIIRFFFNKLISPHAKIITKLNKIHVCSAQRSDLNWFWKPNIKKNVNTVYIKQTQETVSHSYNETTLLVYEGNKI